MELVDEVDEFFVLVVELLYIHAVTRVPGK
jgi:hypothetical protein